MSNQSKYALYLLGVAITTLAEKLELVSCKYDAVNSEVIAYVRCLDSAEGVLQRESKHGEINFDGIIIREAGCKD